MRSLLLIIIGATLLAWPMLAANKDFRGKDLSGKDLANENLNGADLSGANLQSANLKNATLKGANLRDANLSSARLDTADLTEADLRGAKLTKASLESGKFVKANLEGGEIFFAYGNPFDEEGNKKARSVLEAAGVRTEDVSAVMSERNGDLTLKQANLRKATLHGELQGIDFRRADLRGADLHDTKSAEKANFRGAIYDSTTRWPPNFEYEKSGAVKGTELSEIAATPAPFTWIGRWYVNPEQKGAAEEGLIVINKDGTYEWLYSKKAPRVAGKWKPADATKNPSGGDGIVLQKGEGGYDWIAVKAQEHTDRPDSMELKSVEGDLRRWATPLD